MTRSIGGLLLLAVLGAGCSSAAVPVQPRSVVIFTGERIPPDPERMAAVEEWLRPQLEDIERNPSFLIQVSRQDTPAYPWDTLLIEGDTARIFIQHTAVDAETAFLLYAHLRLMAERGEVDPWMPEAAGAEGFALERAILMRIADVWLLGRSVFDTQAHAPLEELLYSRESGFLDAFIFATQGDRFPDARDRWRAESPERVTEFGEWFEQTFERAGPGFIPSGSPAM